jgi:hypothetical protein
VRALTAGSGGWTVTADVALVPFRATVTVAVPRARPVIENEAVRVCAGTMTRSPGSPTIAASLVVRATSVSAGWLAFKVTARVPALPSVSGRIGGAKLTTVGAGTTTVTWLCTLVPVKGPALTVAVPGANAVTVTGAATVPAGIVTVAGTATTPASLVLTGTTVSASWAALMVTVNVPVAP